MKKFTLFLVAMIAALAANAAQTINFKARSLSTVEFEENSWLIYASSDDGQYELSLGIETGSKEIFAGTWTLANMSESDTYLYAPDESYFYDFSEIELTTSGVDGYTIKEACTIKGVAKTVEGDIINIDIEASAPLQPTETVQTSVNVLKAACPSNEEPLKNAYVFTLQDQNNPAVCYLLSLKSLTGKLTEKNMYLSYSGMTNNETHETFMVNHGTLDIALDAQTLVLTVDADLVFSDAKEYKFSFTHQLEAAGEKTLDFINLKLDYTWASDDSYYYQASNKEANVSGFFTASTFDSIPVSDIDVSIKLKENGEERIVYSEAVQSVSVTAEPTLDVVFVGSDMVVYTIHAQFGSTKIKDTIDVVVNEAKFIDTGYGTLWMRGYSGDRKYYAQIAISTSEHEGTFDLSGDLDFCHIRTNISEDGKTYDKLEVYSGIVTLTKTGTLEDGKDIYTLTGQVQAGEYMFNLTMSNGSSPATGIQNTTARPIAVKYLENGRIVIQRNAMKFNTVGARLK